MAEKYLYGVIRNGGAASFGYIGLVDGEREVYAVGQGSVAGVVSDCRGPGLQQLPREELLRRLVIHQQVIERVMRDHTILPARFGTVLPGVSDLRRALRCGARPLAGGLDRFDGLVQYEVAATRELGPVLAEIAAAAGIATLRVAAAGLDPAESMSLRIRIGATVKESLDRRREELRSQLTSLLAEHAADHQANALMGDEMVMNEAFLVPSSAQERFLGYLHQVDARFGGKLRLRCIGPLPPYSFATVEIERPDPKQMDAALRLLGLGERICATAVRRAFREQAARLHPDVNPSPEAVECFSRLRGAEALLAAYCSGKARGDGARESGLCIATRAEVERSYLVAVNRAGDPE